jgi:hypothetical protein
VSLGSNLAEYIPDSEIDCEWSLQEINEL